MEKSKFGINFTLNNYAHSEVLNFIECADGIEGENKLKDRYIDFCAHLLNGKIKPSTMVDNDVIEVFADDLDNRAHIDYLEDHYSLDDEPEIYRGGKMFFNRLNKLKSIHNFIK